MLFRSTGHHAENGPKVVLPAARGPNMPTATGHLAANGRAPGVARRAGNDRRALCGKTGGATLPGHPGPVPSSLRKASRFLPATSRACAPAASRAGKDRPSDGKTRNDTPLSSRNLSGEGAGQHATRRPHLAGGYRSARTGQKDSPRPVLHGPPAGSHRSAAGATVRPARHPAWRKWSFLRSHGGGEGHGPAGRRASRRQARCLGPFGPKVP